MALVALALALSARQAAAGLGMQLGFSPYWDWKTIETEHFRVTFPAELEKTAQKEANYLEEAHQLLAPKLYWQPWYKTQVVVIDNADMANGLTSPQFRFGLVLWVTPPDPWYSTSYYDDWLRLLAIHEYTHLLNMDNVQEFYQPLRYLMGDVLLPNATWPTWMLEGMAVYEETRLTEAGRGRSPLYEMYLRTAVNEGVFDTSRFFKLDQINGSNPYNPGGEAYYSFGYQLLNRIARTPVPDGRTRDGQDPLRDGEDALGLMSLRSASRIPFFINGNLENILGKDWYAVWDEWTDETRARMSGQIEKIKARPLTAIQTLTPANGIQTLGPAPSPDGRWIAYTSDTPERRTGLYLLDLATQATFKVGDKLSGATAAFTPDSRSVVFSAVDRRGQFYQLSDLKAYDLEQERMYRLTDGLRARDPDVSADGKRVAFTLTENESTTLAMASLDRDEGSGKLRVSGVLRLNAAGKYDRVATPRFARDGKTIVYSVHRNGRASEELMSWDIAAGSATVLVGDGKFNRYPAPAPDGSLYYVSNLTGVDNLYRIPPPPSRQPPELATNVISGLSTPVVGPGGTLYAAAYSSSGWSVARIEPLAASVSAADVTVGPPPAPPADEQSKDHSSPQLHEAKSYSIFPSIWPRQWLFIPEIYPGGLYLQEDVEGFDAVDLHSYGLGIGYNTQIPKLDWSLSYSNRQLGPVISVFGSDRTTSFSTDSGGVADYYRKREAGIVASYPIPWTFSSLTPALGVGAQRSYSYFRGYDSANGDLVGISPTVITADASVFFSDVETARLSVAPESGRALAAGVRVYSNPGPRQDILKGVIRGTQYFHLPNHGSLAPSFKGMWTSGFDRFYANANAMVEGRTPELIPGPPGALFDSLSARGYPQARFFSRSALVAALDVRYPILQIFRGWGTNPFFLDNFYGFAFVEATDFPSAKSVPILGSAGAGLTLRMEAFLHIPLSVALELDQGFQSAYGGKTDLFVALNLGSLQF